MQNKLLLIILDGVPYRNWRRLFGNLEGWVDSGEARVWKLRSVLPSISASCYALNRPGFTGDCLVLLTRLYRLCSCFYRMPPRLRLA